MARILVIADGHGVHGARWVDALGELGHRVHWVATRTPTAATSAEVTVLDEIGPSPLRGAVRLAQNGVVVKDLCRAYCPDLIQAQFLVPCGWYAWMSGQRPYTIQLWGSDILRHSEQPAHYRWMSTRALAEAAVVTADSQNLIDVAQSAVPTLRRGPVLSWGVDTAEFQPADDARRAAIKRTLAITTDRVVLCTRNFGPEMNVDVLVDAFGRIARTTAADCTLLLKKGFPLDLSATEVRRAIDASPAGDRIRVIEAEYGYRQMADLYAIADVFVSIPTPGRDGLAQSLLDALASGCVPVVSRNRDTLEIFGDDKAAGVIVDDPANATTVADACAAALRMHGGDAVSRNRAYIQRHFERTTCLRRLDHSIDAVLSTAAATA